MKVKDESESDETESESDDDDDDQWWMMTQKTILHTYVLYDIATQ